MVTQLYAYYPNNYIVSKGWSKTTICKNGFLTDVIEGKIDGKQFKIEEPTCVDISSWNHRDCNHKPLSCKDVR